MREAANPLAVSLVVKELLFQSRTNVWLIDQKTYKRRELLQSPCRGEAGEGCLKVWIVTLPRSSLYLSPARRGLQALGGRDL